MMIKTVLSVALLAASAVADYKCTTNLGSFNIKSSWATAARDNGKNTTNSKSGFPHTFGGGSGSGTTQLTFYGADPKCNEKKPKLYEFPIMKDGSKYNKNEKHSVTETPVRVVYLQDKNLTLCGVMTHVIEDKKTHKGTGDFRVCDATK
ncbi:Ribonuclease/ribotoxin [Hypomontagnella monticulosa]|nr:Ribonuclease/ribotoxin [Hypomontagnella monticulosa]